MWYEPNLHAAGNASLSSRAPQCTVAVGLIVGAEEGVPASGAEYSASSAFWGAPPRLNRFADAPNIIVARWGAVGSLETPQVDPRWTERQQPDSAPKTGITPQPATVRLEHSTLSPGNIHRSDLNCFDRKTSSFSTNLLLAENGRGADIRGCRWADKGPGPGPRAGPPGRLGRLFSPPALFVAFVLAT